MAEHMERFQALETNKITFRKMADCGGLPQAVQPGKLAEAFKYFVQGMGYIPTFGLPKLFSSRTLSASSVASAEGPRRLSHTSAEGDAASGQREVKDGSC